MTKFKQKLLEKILRLLLASLKQAANEQGFVPLREELRKTLPDISDQYTGFKIDTEYLENKVRNMHAFQISLIQPVLGNFNEATIVDIGDSSGTHLNYLKNLNGHNCQLRCLSVNLEKAAVERIKAKGFEAIQARAEDLEKHNIQADIFLCFETLEHLMDPTKFLHAVTKTKVKYFILTVPFVKQSRVGLRPIRKNLFENYYAESTHIFEFSPQDWSLLFKFCGWKVEYEQVYYQYPKNHLLRFTQPYWKEKDFEGFYGARLVPDDSWSKRYQDW